MTIKPPAPVFIPACHVDLLPIIGKIKIIVYVKFNLKIGKKNQQLLLKSGNLETTFPDASCFSYFWRTVCTKNQMILEHTCMNTVLTYCGENHNIIKVTDLWTSPLLGANFWNANFSLAICHRFYRHCQVSGLGNFRSTCSSLDWLKMSLLRRHVLHVFI